MPRRKSQHEIEANVSEPIPSAVQEDEELRTAIVSSAPEVIQEEMPPKSADGSIELVLVKGASYFRGGKYYQRGIPVQVPGALGQELLATGRFNIYRGEGQEKAEESAALKLNDLPQGAVRGGLRKK